MPDLNAFAALAARENDNMHRITPDARLEGNGESAVLIITLSLTEIAKSRKGPKRRGAIGFLFEPIDFIYDGKKYRLYPGWTSLTKR